MKQNDMTITNGKVEKESYVAGAATLFIIFGLGMLALVIAG